MHHDLMPEVGRAAAKLGLTLDQVLGEKRNELRARLHLLSIPSDTIPESQAPAYLRAVLGYTPSPAVVAAATRKRREARLGPEELARVQLVQLARCATCGRRLKTAEAYHVDHKVPIVLGGSNELHNLQLLCSECNLGKGALLDWIIGAQYQREGASPQMRYCALARADQKCERPQIADRQFEQPS